LFVNQWTKEPQTTVLFPPQHCTHSYFSFFLEKTPESIDFLRAVLCVCCAVRAMNLADNVKVLTAGAIAGAVSRTATAPLERLKIFNQVGAISASASLYNKGVWRSLTNMYRDEGVRGFYKGNGTNCVKVVPVSEPHTHNRQRWAQEMLVLLSLGGHTTTDARFT